MSIYPLTIDPMKQMIKATKQKLHHSLSNHSLPADAIVKEAEAFLRSDVRAVPDSEYRALSELTGEPALSEPKVSNHQSFTQH